jgi:spermidine/putrescine transport system substrate-binding protein
MSSRSTRRQFVSRTGSLALAGSISSALLAGCGDDEEGGSTQAERPASGNHPRVPVSEVRFANWPLYIDKENEIPRLERRLEFELRYTEEINDNNEYFGKVRQQLQQGRSINRDLVALTDWMADRWIRLGYTEPLDKRNIPNARNLREQLRNPSWDRGRRHTMPYQSGMTAIGYNRREVGELRSLRQLLEPRYRGKVTLFQDARDTTGIFLLMEGIRPEDATIDQILQAVERVERANADGQIRRFTGNDYTTDLTRGNVVMAMAYSGDMVQLKADNPELDFVIPEEGAILWSDNMMIPQRAPQPYGAELVMNYFYDPRVAARMAEYVNYVSPVEGIRDLVDPELAENPLVFPEADDLRRLSGYPTISAEEELRMNEAFEQVVGA